MQLERSPDLARTSLQLLALGALIAATFWIIRPFLVAIFWAATVAIATWPLLLRVQSRFAGKRGPAVVVMITLLLLIVLVPLYLAVTTIAESVPRIGEWSKSLATLTLPQPPGWVEAIPVIGSNIARRWHQLAVSGPRGLSAYLSPFANTAARWILSQVGNLGLVLAQFLLTVVFTGILYAHGEKAVSATIRIARRLAGRRGENAVYLAAQAVQGVALGVIVTAVVQSLLGGLGLMIAGVPFVALLTAVMFVLAVAQIGPAPVLIGAVIWVYSTSGPVWGTGLLVWTLICSPLDNFLRPVLIRRHANIPLALIFLGVLGGLIAFGVIGLFIGPVVLAVAYTLLTEWMSETELTSRPGPAIP